MSDEDPKSKSSISNLTEVLDIVLLSLIGKSGTIHANKGCIEPLQTRYKENINH